MFKGLVAGGVTSESEQRSKLVGAGAGFLQELVQEGRPGVLSINASVKDVEQLRADEKAKVAARTVDLFRDVGAVGTK